MRREECGPEGGQGRYMINHSVFCSAVHFIYESHDAIDEFVWIEVM